MDSFPENWHVIPLKEIVDKDRPITYGIVQAGPHVEDGIPYIRVSDMANGYLTPDGMLRTSEEIAEKYTRSIVREGDMVCALRGTPGLTLIVPRELDGANLTQGTARIAPDSHADTYFLLQAMSSEFVQKDVLKRAKGSTFVEISLGELNKVRIPLPPLAEQKKIAAILSTWDEAIALTEALIEALQRRKKALMQRLLTGEVRFPGFDGERWVVEKLQNLCERIWIGLVTSMTPHYADSGVPLIRNSNIKENAIDMDEMVFLTHEFANKNKNRQLEPGDVVTVHTGDIGTSAVIQDHFGGAQGFATLNSRVSRRILPAYLCYYFNSTYFKNQAYAVSTGDGRHNLNLKDFVKTHIKLPESTFEQEKIAQLLGNCDKQERSLLQYQSLIKSQKKGLMQQLLTGRVRVNEVQINE